MRTRLTMTFTVTDGAPDGAHEDLQKAVQECFNDRNWGRVALCHDHHGNEVFIAQDEPIIVKVVR